MFFICKSSFQEPLVGQVVLVVIDALRVDHVFNNNELAGTGFRHLVQDYEGPKIPFLRDLMDSKDKQPYSVDPFLSRVHMPTVTLPRIKVSVVESCKTQCLFFSLCTN